MAKRGLDTKWDPLKGKKVLVDRLQVRCWAVACCALFTKVSGLQLASPYPLGGRRPPPLHAAA
jgi:hypothetical protein